MHCHLYIVLGVHNLSIQILLAVYNVYRHICMHIMYIIHPHYIHFFKYLFSIFCATFIASLHLTYYLLNSCLVHRLMQCTFMVSAMVFFNMVHTQLLTFYLILYITVLINQNSQSLLCLSLRAMQTRVRLHLYERVFGYESDSDSDSEETSLCFICCCLSFIIYP